MEIDDLIDLPPQLPPDNFEPVYLKNLNPVREFDDFIKMDKGPHKYYLRGEELTLSVTGFYKYFTGDFDVVGTATKIIERQRDHETCLEQGIKVTRPDWFLKQYERYQHCRTVEDMQHEWNVNRDKGTATHRLIELYYNNLLNEDFLSRHPDCLAADFQQFLRFHREKIEAAGFEPFRTEFTMYKFRIGGQIDMLYRLKADRDHPVNKYRLWMVDWKRKFDLGLFGDPYTGPFASLTPGDLSKFTIQLNTYKSMIESATPYRIMKMSILLVHPNMENYRLEPIADIQPAIAEMFERRRHVVVQELCTKVVEEIRAHVLSENVSERNETVAIARDWLNEVLAIDNSITMK
jgi:hypothetical protein